MSKRTQDEVSAELVFQMGEKLDLQKVKEQEDRMYADLWHADMMAKVRVVFSLSHSRCGTHLINAYLITLSLL